MMKYLEGEVEQKQKRWKGWRGCIKLRKSRRSKNSRRGRIDRQDRKGSIKRNQKKRRVAIGAFRIDKGNSRRRI